MAEKYVGTFDLYVNCILPSRRMYLYLSPHRFGGKASNRGMVVVNENGSVVYSWVGKPADLIDLPAIKKALSA